MSKRIVSGDLEYTNKRIVSGDLKDALTKIDVSTKDGKLTKAAAQRIFNCLIDSIKEHLTEVGDEVAILGLGTFKVVRSAARTCKNPATGETLHVPEKDRVKFKASSNILK